MALGNCKEVAPGAIKAAKERWQALAALGQGINQLTAAEALGTLKTLGVLAALKRLFSFRFFSPGIWQQSLPKWAQLRRYIGG